VIAPARVLIIDDDKGVRSSVSRILRQYGYDVLTAEDGRAGLDIIESDHIDVALVDMAMPRMRGIEVLRHARRSAPKTVCIVVTGDGDVDLAYRCLELGAFDYLEKPYGNFTQFAAKLKRATEVARLRRDADPMRLNDPAERLLVGNSEGMVRVRRQIRQVAESDVTVQIFGESGTGKELVARALHQMSGRSGRFLRQNCGVLRESLAESHLFGHRRGAFSGAVRDQPGIFESAASGTILLDEIGDLDLDLQVKLLRVIEYGEYSPIGETETVFENTARIVTATHRDLEQRVAEGSFREDLYYRLNIFTIELPPLRERREDIRPLTLRFVHEFNELENKQIRYVAPEAMELLEHADWPGNVRQLRHEIRRAVLCSSGELLTRDLLLDGARPSRPPVTESMTPDEYLELPWAQAKERVVEAFAHLYLRHHLQQGGSITAAAETAGMARPNFSRLLKRFGVDPVS